MTDKLDAALDFTLRWEGGYVNDPDDPGGMTKFGISARANPGVDIENLTLAQAKEIYREKYWNEVHGDRWDTPVAIVLFDWAVHAGPNRAIKGLQRCAGARVDGKLGPETISKVNKCGPLLPHLLVQRRSKSLCKLVIQRPTMGKFLVGWMARCLDLMAVVSAA
jgi:lysozyme family protein